MAIINTLKVVGTSLPVRQSRISMIVDGSPVFFKPEPTNAYDPLAIAVVNEKGHLGYIGKDDPQRERIRKALENGFVIARGNVIGGFRKRDGSYASYGLRVEWYSVDGAYKFHEYQKDEDEAEITVAFKRNSAQKKKVFSGNKYKGKEARKDLALGNVERDRGLMRKAGNSTRRAAFKRGEDIKPSHLREDSRYYHFIQCGEWHPFDDDLTLPYMKETLPRKNKYITEAEAYERRVS